MATPAERVRSLLGEVIPPGGVDSDTLFTDVEILDLLTASGNDVNQAVLDGWRRKAAAYAELVDVQEGTSKRAMSDLHANALRMVDHYKGEMSTGVTAGRTRIHKIVRP